MGATLVKDTTSSQFALVPLRRDLHPGHAADSLCGPFRIWKIKCRMHEGLFGNLESEAPIRGKLTISKRCIFLISGSLDSSSSLLN